MLLNRRDWLSHAGGTLGSVGLAGLLAREGRVFANGETVAPDHLTIKKSHFPAKAKAVIYLFMHGGPSHMDILETPVPRP